MSAVGIRDVSETPGLYGRARQVGRFLPGVVAARHKAEDSTGVRIPAKRTIVVDRWSQVGHRRRPTQKRHRATPAGAAE